MNMMVLLMLMIWSMMMNDDAENHADELKRVASLTTGLNVGTL